jgi:thioredoxin reductase (NADPH)
MTSPTDIRDTIILGSGPAGLTAAIYTARANCAPLLIHGFQPGGQLTTTSDVENFPGFPDGIDGGTLMQLMENQAKRFGTTFLQGEVTRVDLTQAPFSVWLDDVSYQARTLIIATGAKAKMLGLPNEWDLYGRGVSVCATCDGFFYRDREIVVVGGGDTAVEEATFLTRFASKVTVVHRRDTLRATPALQERARNNPKINFLWDSAVSEILANDKREVRGIKVTNLKNSTITELPCDGLFVAIGHHPNTQLFAGQLEMDDYGYILTRNGSETNIPGVFAAGDVQDSVFRQAVTAAGSGCMAALLAERYLEDLGR